MRHQPHSLHTGTGPNPKGLRPGLPVGRHMGRASPTPERRLPLPHQGPARISRCYAGGLSTPRPSRGAAKCSPGLR